MFTNITGEEIFQNEIKSCIINNVFSIPSPPLPVEIPLEKDFTTLQDYIEDNPDVNIPGVTDYLNQEYAGTHCYPYFGTVKTSGELEIDKQYIIHSINPGDDFSNVGFIQLHHIFTATGTTPISWTNFTEVEETTCGERVLQDYNVTIAEVINEEADKIESKFPDDYSRVTSSSCSIYEIGSDGDPVRDEFFAYVYDKTGGCDSNNYAGRKKNI